MAPFKSRSKIVILVVVGTRPEAIKMAPVIKELLRRSAKLEVKVCLTAQHRDLLDQVIEAFDLPVHYDLNLMRPNQSLSQITAAVVIGLQDVLDEVRPDAVLVHGDTTTSFAAALAAFYRKVPVGHVEAGLRTYNKYQPFPEEINRRLCDAICDYHYAPTKRARENLLKEAFTDQSIRVTGNTVVDALLEVAQKPYVFEDESLEQAGKNNSLILVTAHRRESFGEPFQNMCKAIRDIARDNPDVEVIYPVHPNPNVRKAVNEILQNADRVRLIPPLDYVPFVNLLKKATLVLTDSGGIQEEAPSLGKPVLVMRDVTERPEAVEAGTALLVGTAYRSIYDCVQRLLDDADFYNSMANAVNPYGDGRASMRIADDLEQRIKE